MKNKGSCLILILIIGLFFSCSDSDRDIGSDLYDFVLLDIKDSQDVRDTADYNYLDIFAYDVLGDYFSDLDASESADTKDVEYEDISETEIIRPRVVFKVADDSLPMGENLLINSDFEKIESGGFSNWRPYRGGYVADQGRSGGGVLLERKEGDTEQYGIYQVVTLNQKSKKSIFFSGWSKSENLTGNPDAAASIYLDIKYVTIDEDPINGCDPNVIPNCALYGQIPNPRFDTGTHDWQKRYGFATPLHPIKTVAFYLLLRGDHYGKMWFDDVELREVDSEIVNFDSTKVAVIKPNSEYKTLDEMRLETGDGFILSFAKSGGVINGLYYNGKNLKGKSEDFTSGVIYHEIGSKEWIASGGALEKIGNTYKLSTDMGPYGLSLSAYFAPTNDSINAKIEIEGLESKKRAFTVYFAVPLDIENGIWGRDIRREVLASSYDELSETVSFWYDKLGYTGRFSSYPIGSVYNSDLGIVVSVPPDIPGIFRISYNNSLKMLFVAFDMAISPDTDKFKNKAWCEFVLYKVSDIGQGNGFRVALNEFYKRFPDAFKRRIPPEKEGIWVAFADLSKVINEENQSIKDFNIGIHETGDLRHVEFDDANDILTFRYIIEPASTWLMIQDSNTNIEDYESVMDYIEKLYTTGSAHEKKIAEKTLSSGVFNELNRFIYQPFQSGPPWCPGKCVLFYLSPDPDINVKPYTLNQAKYYVNERTLGVYKNYPGLDGEYVDSFLMWGTYLNQRVEHFKVTDTPLTFKTTNTDQIGIPVIFSTIKFTKWLRNQLPEGKYLISNGVLAGKVMWGYDLFDFMGQEIKWIRETNNGPEFVPEPDEYLSYRRALSYQKPYGFLMNVNFNNMSYEMVEKYMKICLFYGIYPSMFSHNAAEDNYFSLPQFYQRDRPLFKKYIPLIREINKAGWEPITHAFTNDKDVYIERFGRFDKGLYFTIRNMSDSEKVVIIHVDRKSLKIPYDVEIKSMILGERVKTLISSEETFEVKLSSKEVELIKIETKNR